MLSDSNRHLSRRRFCSLTAAGLASASLPQAVWGAGNSIPVGIQLYTVNADMQKDPAATLKKIASIGYTEVETAGFGKLTAAQFHDLLHDAGLRAPSAHLNFGMADTQKLLDDAKAIGSEYVVSSVLLPASKKPAGRGDFMTTLNSLTADDFKASAATANEIAGKAKAAGLQFAYHNHNFEFRDLGGGHTGYDILMRETDPSLVKFEADTGWMKVGGADPVQFLTSHPERFVMLHIKDFKNLTRPITQLGGADAPAPTELGRGSIDIKTIVAAGRKAGIRHMFVEQEPPFSEMPALQAAAVDYQALHALLSNG